MIANRASSLVTFSIVTLLLTAGCTGTSPNASPRDQPDSPPNLAEVVLGDITPVVTLAADARSGITFQITAPSSGILRAAASGEISVENEAGDLIPVPVDPRTTAIQMLVSTGQPVVKSLPIASAIYTSFALVAPIEGADLIRFMANPDSARAQLDESGAPFDCDFLDVIPTTLPQDPTSHFMACKVPKDQAVISGLTGVIAFRFPGVRDVLVLPVQAVAGTIRSGLVTRVEADTETEVPVELGLTDGISIEVSGGLVVGDKVRIPNPGLLAG